MAHLKAAVAVAWDVVGSVWSGDIGSPSRWPSGSNQVASPERTPTPWTDAFLTLAGQSRRPWSTLHTDWRSGERTVGYPTGCRT